MVQKRIEFFQDYNDEEMEESSLLQTIKVPRNLLFLSDKLPQPNYKIEEKEINTYSVKPQGSLPDIIIKSKRNPDNNIEKILEDKKREKQKQDAARQPSQVDTRNNRSHDVHLIPASKIVNRQSRCR